MAQRCDVLIIGAGPAGAVAARQIALGGRRVLLVERGGRARDKACGHCLSVRGVMRLEALGLGDAVRESRVGGTRGVRVVTAANGRGESRALSIAMPADGVLVDRARFDEALTEHAARAGAEVRHGTVATIDDESACADGWRVRLRRTARGSASAANRRERDELVEAALVIGSDGVGSGVARRLGWGPRRPGRSFGFSGGVEFAHVAGLRDALEFGGEPRIFMHVGSGGYLGAVQRDDGRAHLGALVRGSGPLREPVAFLRHLAEELGLAWLRRALMNESPRWSATGPMPWRPRRVADSRAALIGDAAGYIEPFTGEGMTWAIESGRLLAETIVLEQPLTTYAARWRTTIGVEQRRCAWIARLVARPRLLSLVGSAAPAWASLMAQRVVGAPSMAVPA